ncbi:hypothetical protein [Haliscomenobacter hydrossis]|uniref:VapC45 PIN like domain-containing protein n=1 Tax=Haliscomenobacter hydrossis (strain ATCC 27775 / DSM 1100 / LMG 10767 / O) TaxID=760192 RepID=F4L228_HALH1|nr:hypothetical protein [Haliscomenobacter hydrossis]AEE50661.1 hypothetical protein Halhy_2793 [Haliscomenobacter hydrossis DSM 1100]
MKLFIDNQYSPRFIKLITSLHDMQFGKCYEIVTGQWSEEYKPANTVVFLWDTSKKGISPQIKRHYADGYKVFAYKKPYGERLDIFKVSLVMLSQWKKILKTVEKEEGPFLFIVNDSKRALRRVD